MMTDDLLDSDEFEEGFAGDGEDDESMIVDPKLTLLVRERHATRARKWYGRLSDEYFTLTLTAVLVSGSLCAAVNSLIVLCALWTAYPPAKQPLAYTCLFSFIVFGGALGIMITSIRNVQFYKRTVRVYMSASADAVMRRPI